MAAMQTWRSLGFIWYDVTGNNNPIAPFQVLSIANATECAAAAAAGVRAAVPGQLVIATPVAALLGQTIASRRIIGVSKNAAFVGDQVNVQVEGVAEVMMNSACNEGDMINAVAQALCTNQQAPIANTPEMLIPFDPRATITYNLSLAGNPALTYNSNGENQPFFPLGYAMEAALEQYDVIPVHLMLTPLVG